MPDLFIPFLWSSHCTRIFGLCTIPNFKSKIFLKFKTLAKIRGRHKLIPGSQISRFWPSGESASHHLLISNAQLRRENDFCIENCCRNGFSEKKKGNFQNFPKFQFFQKIFPEIIIFCYLQAFQTWICMFFLVLETMRISIWIDLKSKIWNFWNFQNFDKFWSYICTQGCHCSLDDEQVPDLFMPFL